MSDNEREAILSRVRTIITELIDVDPDAIKMDADLREDLRVDSLDSVEIVMALEEAFGIEIREEQASALRTVGDLVQSIATVQQNASNSAHVA